MKLKSILMGSLVLVIIGGAGTLLNQAKPNNEQNLSSAKDTSELIDFSLPFSPGEEWVYQGELHFELNMQQGEGNQTQNFALALNLHLRSYYIEDDTLTWSMTATDIRALDGTVLAEEMPSQSQPLYINSKDGVIQSLHSPQSKNEMLSSLLKSTAARIQIPTPQPKFNPLPYGWEASERDNNGKYRLYIDSDEIGEKLTITKNYLGLVSQQNLQLANGTRVELEYDQSHFRLQGFSFDFGIKSEDALLTIDAMQRAKFKLISHERGLSIGNVIADNQDTLVASTPTSRQFYSSQSKKQRMESMLEGYTKEQILQIVASFEGGQDQRVSLALDKLEALVFLNPETGKQLLKHLETQMGESNLSTQLSVVMGALSTMPADHIESELLDFAAKYADHKDVELQSSFAMAELEGSSQRVYDHLTSLSQGTDSQSRSTGLLSLGVLGRQNEHRDEVRFALRERFSEAPEDQKGLTLAAINNSHDPDNLEINLSHLDSSDEFVASQAAFGLGFSDSEEAYRALTKVMTRDSRLSVLQRAIEALANHLERDGAVRHLIEFSSEQTSVPLIIAVINVLAGSQNPDARDYIEAMSEQSEFEEIQIHAQKTLLTMSASQSY